MYSDGEIKVLFEDNSDVQNQHKSGGQSSVRFERNRQIEINKWFKELNDKLMKTNREFYVGCSSIYYNRFLEKLHTYNKAKIKEQITNSYSNLAGIYEMINILNYRKK